MYSFIKIISLTYKILTDKYFVKNPLLKLIIKYFKYITRQISTRILSYTIGSTKVKIIY